MLEISSVRTFQKEIAVDTYDVLVVGAGVVGCAIARELSQRNYRVIVVERNEGPGLETSLLNSGVIHSGIHLNPKFLKAKLVAEGKAMVVDYCARNPQVPLRQVGMHIVVAPGDMMHLTGELRSLYRMLRRARTLNVSCQLVSRRKMLDREPEIRCVFALFIPENCIIDSGKFVESLAADAGKGGTTFAYSEAVKGICRGYPGVVVETSANTYKCQLVINAAGLNAHKVAELAGYGRYSQVYYRGEYYEVRRSSEIHVGSLVYPVHRPGNPGLGVHITPRIDGRLLLGPNARRVQKATDLETDKTPAKAFLDDVSTFLPRLQIQDLVWAFAGIRPKLTEERGENDFEVALDDHLVPMINLIGIESPGLTASMALARHVARMMPF